MIGQFVWTGFDYLGEPSPYDTDAWPNHSSVFGIIDLASLPKDRFWLYRSVWNVKDPTLHVLPHWTWPGREGQITPVFVYTSWPSAELFINGVSHGRRSFSQASVLTRHRLMWDDVVYEPGELKVVAYDASGAVADTRVVRTAGKPYALRCEVASAGGLDASAGASLAAGGPSSHAGRSAASLAAGGDDLAYITVTVVDKAGNPVPTASNLVQIKVSGAGRFEAVANGDPTCLESFCEPRMHLFSGALTFIVRAGEDAGTLEYTVSGRGLRKASGTIAVK